ncbi:MAG: permease [Proteobacteria bacterium]|nr:permease [Pseudomonadota bacterium]MBU1583156.1 permease [Pseudomonadota bacterium]MBU2452933.1 permease [Pseudomonadota bacterium]MBU2627523.1 permease [Pseudomonadota bacterium]
MKYIDNDLKNTPFPIAPGCGCQPHEVQVKAVSSVGRNIQVLFIVSALILVTFHPRSEQFITFSIIFSSIILEAFPFMLLGTLLGGFIEVFLSRERLINLLPKKKHDAIVLAALLGIIFPVCECAIVPVVRKFLNKGMPLGSAVAFLLAGPIVNPLVFASTCVAYSFNFKIAVLRSFAGFFIAVTIGLIIDSCLSKTQTLIETTPAHTCSLCHDNANLKNQSLRKKVFAAFQHGAADFYDIGRFLIIGAFIAAALQTFVSRQVFTSVLTGPVTAIVSMMVLAVVLNLCSEADAFIASSFQSAGVPFSAQLAFLVLGPMLDIKLIMMYLSVFTKKMIITLSSLVIFFVFFAMLFLEVSGWL